MNNIIGMKKEYLTCIEVLPSRVTNDGHKTSFVKVSCECGKTREMRRSSFLGKQQKHCGRDCGIKMAKILPSIGQTFGKYTVIAILEKDEMNPQQRVTVRCACGYEKNTLLHILKSGSGKQCKHCAIQARRIQIEVGTRFDRWVVQSTFVDENGFTLANCLCDCGTERTIRMNNLMRKKRNKESIRSCGCANKKDLTGEVFGLLTVLREGPIRHRVYKNRKTTKRVWVCQCACGTEEKHVIQSELTTGSTRSCGCLLSSEKRSERMKGENNPMYGIRGPQNPTWKPERTHEQRVKERKEHRYYTWRKAVYERDNYQCKCCGDDTGGNLVAHHVYNYADFPKVRYHVSNGITLCNACHNGFHSMYGKHRNTGAQLEDYLNVTLQTERFLTIEEMMEDKEVIRDNYSRIKPYIVQNPNGEKKDYYTYEEIRKEVGIPITASLQSVLHGKPYEKRKVVAVKGGKVVKEFASFLEAGRYYGCSSSTLKTYIYRVYEGNNIKGLQGISFEQHVDTYLVTRKDEAYLKDCLEKRLKKVI